MCTSMLVVELLLAAALGAGGEGDVGKTPIFYSSDLNHPHGDPDDHFDIATLVGD